MKIEIIATEKEVTVVQKTKHHVIFLSSEELVALRVIVGNVGGTGEVRVVSDDLYRYLNDYIGPNSITGHDLVERSMLTRGELRDYHGVTWAIQSLENKLKD